MKANCLIAILTYCLLSCHQKESFDIYNLKASEPILYHQASTHLTDVIIHDIFKPPVASRIYAYANLAAYEALIPEYDQYQSLGGQLTKFEIPTQPNPNTVYCYPVASLSAFIAVSKKLTFSEQLWDDYEEELGEKFKNMGIPQDVIARSMDYGRLIAKHVLAYASKDNYDKIRGYRYTVTSLPGSWVPTPPAYADACEPKWNSVRSFCLDSVNQFQSPLPTPYDLNKGSEFMKLTMEVYNTSKNLTQKQKASAFFWDDNAFVTNVVGHATYASKKMTPAGHWLAIIRTVSTDKKLDLMKTVETYTLGSIALYDGFIACWDEKYKTARIRPETVINNNLDPDWRPFLETPSFPEYVSGHSTISASCGVVLENIFGPNIAFTDTTEKKYGHGVKSFKSFEEAYWDVSFSRLYGGIHFRDGIVQGTLLGKKIGENVLKRLKTRRMPGQAIDSPRSEQPLKAKTS